MAAEDDASDACEHAVEVVRGAMARGVGCPRRREGWLGRGRQVVARFFFQHGMFCVGFRCWFITRPSPVLVWCVVWGQGCVVRGVLWAEAQPVP